VTDGLRPEEVLIWEALERFRATVRALKALHDYNDDDIAREGHYTSRQVANSRVTGRTIADITDFVRLGLAFHVEPFVLLLDKGAALRQATANDGTEAS
jgi:hypothetical protein